MLPDSEEQRRFSGTNYLIMSLLKALRISKKTFCRTTRLFFYLGCNLLRSSAIVFVIAVIDFEISNYIACASCVRVITFFQKEGFHCWVIKRVVIASPCSVVIRIIRIFRKNLSNRRMRLIRGI